MITTLILPPALEMCFVAKEHYGLWHAGKRELLPVQFTIHEDAHWLTVRPNSRSTGRGSHRDVLGPAHGVGAIPSALLSFRHGVQGENGAGSDSRLWVSSSGGYCSDSTYYGYNCNASVCHLLLLYSGSQFWLGSMDSFNSAPEVKPTGLSGLSTLTLNSPCKNKKGIQLGFIRFPFLPILKKLKGQ